MTLKSRALMSGGVLLALVAAFLAGKYSAPVKTVERVKVETKVETKIEWRDRIVEKRVEGPVRIRTVVIEKEGERRTETTEERAPVVVDTSTAKDGGASVESDTKSDALRITESARPGWRASVAAGWNPSALRLDPSVYELRLERRLLGTLWLGAWGRTDRTGGLSLAMEW